MKQQATHLPVFTRGVILFALLMLSACSTGQAKEEATPTPIPTPIIPTKPTYQVQVGDITNQLEYSGRIAPVVEDELYFEAGGRVDKVYVVKGDSVTKGELLAEIKSGASDFDLRRAQIGLANAQLALQVYMDNAPSLAARKATALQNLANAEKAVSDAQYALNSSNATASQADIDTAYAQMVLAKESLAKAQAAYEPYANKPDDNLTKASLRSQLSAAQQVYNAAVSHYNGLTNPGSQYDQEMAQANLMLAQANLTKAQQEWDQLQNETEATFTDPDLVMKQNDVELAQINLDQLQATVNSARIVSPITGTVLLISIEDGSDVNAYDKVITVADLNKLEVRADLTTQELSQVAEGMVASVTPVGKPDEAVEGTVRSLPYPYGTGSDAQGEGETTPRISLKVDPVSLGYATGDLVNITIVLEHKNNVLWLPPQAIRNFEGRTFVIVQDGEGQRRVDVKVGIEAEDRVEILDGLTEGQTVVAP
jgi:HlyD family secretion protein